jgi:DNA-3-methyladenine glycosylase
VAADQLAVEPVQAAHRLLGATLTGRGVTATIVEVEAYGGSPDGPWPDAAAHSFRGPTARNAVMFGPPGRLYTYRSHGIHVCANVVCATDGVAAAVLLRAATIETGLEVAQTRRGPSIQTRSLGRGPGNLCSATGIIMADNGIDLFNADSPIRLTAKPLPGRAWVSARQPTGPGGCGCPGGPRCRPTVAAPARRRPAPATDSDAPGADPARRCGKIYHCGR